MRPIHVLLLLASLAACGGAPPAPPRLEAEGRPAGAPAEREGRVSRIGAEVWAVTPADEPTTRYCLEGALAAPELRVDGKKVRFSVRADSLPRAPARDPTGQTDFDFDAAS
jgi:hypothetical protein